MLAPYKNKLEKRTITIQTMEKFILCLNSVYKINTLDPYRQSLHMLLTEFPINQIYPLLEYTDKLYIKPQEYTTFLDSYTKNNHVPPNLPRTIYDVSLDIIIHIFKNIDYPDKLKFYYICEDELLKCIRLTDDQLEENRSRYMEDDYRFIFNRINDNNLKTIYGLRLLYIIFNLSFNNLSMFKVMSKTKEDILSQRRRTFYAASEFFDKPEINKMFLGMIYTVDFPDCVYLDGKFVYTKGVPIQCVVKNIMDTGKKSITDKSLLYINMVKEYPYIAEKHMMEQYTASINVRDNFQGIFKNIDRNNRWIIKPVAGFQGKGIGIVNNYSEFQKHLSGLFRDRTIKSIMDKNPNYVVSKFLSNPLLIDDRVFSIRSYLICINKWDERYAFLLNTGYIQLAKEPYDSKNNSFDSNVNHSMKNERISGYEEIKRVVNDQDYKSILKQIKEISYYVFKLNKGKSYPESKNSFEVFGLDFIVSNKAEVKLIECNDKIGEGLLRVKSEYLNAVSSVYRWILDDKPLSKYLINCNNPDKYTYVVDVANDDNDVLKNTILDEFRRRKNDWQPYINDMNYKYVSELSRYEQKEYINGNGYSLFYRQGPSTFNHNVYHKIKGVLKNVSTDKRYMIGAKDSLYDNWIAYFPQCYTYMANQYNINIKTLKYEDYKHLFNDKKVWAIKPVFGFKGLGIEVVNTYTAFVDYMKKIKEVKDPKSRFNLPNSQKEETFYRWVLSEFIAEPLLIYNRTYSIRIHMVEIRSKTGSKCYMCEDTGIIKLAKNEFKLVLDPEYLISHSGDITIPFKKTILDEFGEEKYNIIKSHIRRIINNLAALRTVECYAESTNCFKIYGLDFIINNDYIPILLECNSNPGAQYPDPNIYTEMLFEIFDKVFYSEYSRDTHHLELVSDIRNNNYMFPKFNGFNNIYTERLIIREFKVQDLKSLQKMFSNTKNMSHIYTGKVWFPKQTEDALYRKFIKEKYTMYAIELNQELIGIVGYYDAKYLFPELKDKMLLRIMIDVNYRGKGYAYEALKGLISYMTTEKHIYPIYSIINDDNIPSIQLHERLGFEKSNIIIMENRKLYMYLEGDDVRKNKE